MEDQKKIIFYDGTCGLCHGFVQQILKKDKKQILKFASLQGVTAKQLLLVEDSSSLKTVIYFRDGKFLRKSEAVLKVLIDLEGVWKLLGFLGSMIPNRMGNFVYDFIAINRFKWFGRKEECYLPLESQKHLFLP